MYDPLSNPIDPATRALYAASDCSYVRFNQSGLQRHPSSVIRACEMPNSLPTSVYCVGVVELHLDDDQRGVFITRSSALHLVVILVLIRKTGSLRRPHRIESKQPNGSRSLLRLTHFRPPLRMLALGSTPPSLPDGKVFRL